jgi:hypothetical protein
MLPGVIYMNDRILKEKYQNVDFCVVGGGMAGLVAAIAAARCGAKVVLMHDRPVLGGNASSEIRMWVCGCHGKNNRETGILEEISLENMYRNPTKNYSIWDSILYEKVKQEENITLLLNCSCNDVQMDGNKIKTIKGWQLTTYTWHMIEAKYYADCSGDSILAPLTGAEFRVGREGFDEFLEDIAPQTADKNTMGLSCLIQARETGKPIKYIPPTWANKYESDEQLPLRDHDMKAWHTNFWWMELGGVQDTIHDTEEIRDELLKVAFGVWDHIKNKGDHDADNWELDWVGFLPGKRESRRYVGDHIMTQHDIRSEGRFDDIVAYAGWSMDDHHPEGIHYPGKPTIFHKAPSPYGIPYRSMYSKNIDNLFFAGRNISVTHTAMSSTRVMGTCSIIGQAVGTAAAMASKYNLSPRGIYEGKIEELKQKLMDDDCYLPWNIRTIPNLTKKAKLIAVEGNAEALRNGIDRPIEDVDNGWTGSIGSMIAYDFGKSEKLTKIRFVFDSDLNRETCTGHKNLKNYATIANRFYDMDAFGFPETMVKSFRLEYLSENGEWKLLKQVDDNYQRLVYINTDVVTKAIRFTPIETWGSEEVHIFSWEIK